MPMITIKYDDAQIQDDQIILLSKAIQKIVIETTGIKEVFVYADSPKIKIDVAPVEVFIEMSTQKISDKQKLFEDIKKQLSEWKKANTFTIPITITLVPMEWQFEVAI